MSMSCPIRQVRDMSATSVGEIGLDLVVNQNQFNKQMSGITSLAKKAGAALAGAFAVKKVVDFGKQCLELGSDLQEVQNVVDVTFPSMTAQVDKFAKSAAQSFGLSETMAKQYTGTFGAMAKAFGFSESAAYEMSTALTGLAGDVASFYNLSQDEAYTKLKSVFTGETETLKDLGVVMTQAALDQYALANGYGKTTAAMTEQEKVALRYAFVQQQLSAAQGDFARTSDSWANQTRVMALQLQSIMATIGQGLINLFTPVIKIVNVVLGKIATLANAFKSFTELITGKKSSGSSTVAVPVSELASAADTASSGLSGTSGAADCLADSTKGVGSAAKKAAKEMRALMGFDKINRLDAQDTSDDTGSSAPSSGVSGVGGGNLGSAVDFGNLAEGETVIEETDKQLSALIKRCKQLAAIFKKGFKIGFGDSEKKIKSIQKNLENIGETLEEIFTDPKVISSANRCMDSIAEAFGKFAGSVARIGLTIADNLTGGISKYLSSSKKYIQDRLVSLFDVTGEIAKLGGDFSVAIADIFDVFSGDDAKKITADLIGIFSDGFLGIIDLGWKFTSDVLNMIVTPVTENVGKIRTAFEETLTPIRVVLDTLYLAVQETFEKIFQIYDEHIKPFLDSIAQGIAQIVAVFLEAWNTYIVPILDYLAEKFTTVWIEHIQPMLNGVVELFGKIADNLKALWETLLVPLLNWLIEEMAPILGKGLKNLGDEFFDLLSVVADVFAGITEILGGFLDFCTGAFTGDFDKCWEGINGIIQGFQKIAGTIFEYVRKQILQPFIDFVKGVFETDWTESFGALGEVLNGFFDTIQEVWKDIKKTFNGIVTFLNGVFKGDWESAWEGIVGIFEGIFGGIIDLAKRPLNAVIDLVNSLIAKLNNGLAAIESAFSFDYDFKNPLTGTRHYGHYGLSLPSVPEIPHLARGGFVERNTPQLAMIGDNRHQGEIVAPEDKLREMALEAVRAAGGTGITRDELESIINRAVMRIVAALANMGFYLDSTQIESVLQRTRQSMDIRYNTAEVK